jgi:uncharacterized protein YrrD
MITNFKSAIKKWVFTKNGDELPVARTVDFVVDPNNGKVVAIWVATTDGLKLLSINDVLKWHSNKIVITDQNEFLKAEEFPKITSILNREVPIIGANVFSIKDKEFLGVVRNFNFNTASPRILSIFIKKGIWPFNTNRIIPRNQIIDISESGIFIENEIKISTKIAFGNDKIAKAEK